MSGARADMDDADPPLARAKAAAARGDFTAGAQGAMAALRCDERDVAAWRLLGFCNEQLGALDRALQCFEAALALAPEAAGVVGDLGRVALKAGQFALAEQFLRLELERQPGALIAAQELARALRAQKKIDEAIEVLAGATQANPAAAPLWSQLAAVLAEQGRMAEALVFAEEAVRLDEHSSQPTYNRANIHWAFARTAEAIAGCERAIARAPTPADAALMGLARATMLLGSGAVTAGWDAYRVRLDPAYGGAVRFEIDRPQLTDPAALDGLSLLLVGEQGLGDEVMFANAVPDVIAALGPRGRLTLAVEPRLVPLFRRSFAGTHVLAHHSESVGGRVQRQVPGVDLATIDAWAPLGAPLAWFRGAVADFPTAPAFLTPDAAQTAHWRERLAALGPGPKIGLTWKSLRDGPERSRHYAPFEAWAPLFALPGASVVSLQYGETGAEQRAAAALWGAALHTDLGLDLRDDLDGVAALSAALDFVVGPANATTNIAGACGARLGLVTSLEAWPRLGTDHYPWYPVARVFRPHAPCAWDGPIAGIAYWIASPGDAPPP